MDRGVQMRQCILCLAKGPHLNSRDQDLHVFAVVQEQSTGSVRSSFGCSCKLVCFQERLQGADLPLLRLCEALEQNKSKKSMRERRDKKRATHALSCLFSSSLSYPASPVDHSFLYYSPTFLYMSLFSILSVFLCCLHAAILFSTPFFCMKIVHTTLKGQLFF